MLRMAREAELLALARRAFDEDQPAVMTAEELSAAVEKARGESLDLPQMPRE